MNDIETAEYWLFSYKTKYRNISQFDKPKMNVKNMKRLINLINQNTLRALFLAKVWANFFNFSENSFLRCQVSNQVSNFFYRHLFHSSLKSTIYFGWKYRYWKHWVVYWEAIRVFKGTFDWMISPDNTSERAYHFL